MAELTTQERLQPSLLDRLLDDEPGSKSESRDKRVLSLKQLRACVLRDVGSVLNTACYYPLSDLQHLPYVAKSVINFGCAEFTGVTVSGINSGQLEQRLRESLWNFEPRLVRETMKISIQSSTDKMSRQAVRIAIEADLWAEPVPLRIFMKTEIDLDTGHAQVVEDRT